MLYSCYQKLTIHTTLASLFYLPLTATAKMRHAGSPAFTSGKLKHMSKIINKVASDLVAYLNTVGQITT